ncbi:MAG: hypothetical protein K2H15_04370 [Muribaculaceae bacterium]|nr:hypothetical protein [Muribaculaceae bacterium]
MEETYEEIVRKWYLKLQGNFTSLMLERYRNSNLQLADVENIYQDVFIAIRENLRNGRVKENTNWESYIIRIGLNMAGKKYRHIKDVDSIDEPSDDSEKISNKAQRISNLISSLSSDDEEADLNSNLEAHLLLGDELSHTPEPCASIIRMTYYEDMTDAEISQQIPAYRDNGKTLSTNAKAVKARRWLCMRDLIYRVKLALYVAGIIDEKPIKQKRNGR